MKELLDTHLLKRMQELKGGAGSHAHEQHPQQKLSVNLAPGDVDLQALHEAYQFLHQKYVDNVEESQERMKMLEKDCRQKRDTLDIVKSKPVLLGNLLDMPPVDGFTGGRKLRYFGGRVPNINIFKIKKPQETEASADTMVEQDMEVERQEGGAESGQE